VLQVAVRAPVALKAASGQVVVPVVAVAAVAVEVASVVEVV
jgi:hypothetical protein